MESSTPNWSKEEFKTYLLIYCAHADFQENQKEKAFIKNKTSELNFHAIHEEFEQDNDFQSIQKIKHSAEKHGYNAKEIDRLFEEIKALFLSDGDFDLLEKNLFRGLKRILN